MATLPNLRCLCVNEHAVKNCGKPASRVHLLRVSPLDRPLFARGLLCDKCSIDMLARHRNCKEAYWERMDLPIEEYIDRYGADALINAMINEAHCF